MKFYSHIPQTFTLNCNGRLISLKDPLIMGILNMTPDSFSDGGEFNTEIKALKHAEKMIKEGADIIDIGPQSSNPHSHQISAKEEQQRLGKIIQKIKSKFPDILVSVDTYYADTVKFAADQGMDIINDISGGQFDDQMFPTAAKTGLPYILMHINPTFESRHEKIHYDDVTGSINYFFAQRLEWLNSLSIRDIILDPGFGFGKTMADQYKMIDEAQYFGWGKYPLLIGISRKSFIYKALGKSPLEISEETQKLHIKVLEKGANILRVHDVAVTREIVQQFINRRKAIS